MALKDWKKIGSGVVPSWQNKKTEQKILIFKNTIGGQTDYNVKITRISFKDFQPTWHIFKTKSQALKFAKSYMRRH